MKIKKKMLKRIIAEELQKSKREPTVEQINSMIQEINRDLKGLGSAISGYVNESKKKSPQELLADLEVLREAVGVIRGLAEIQKEDK